MEREVGVAKQALTPAPDSSCTWESHGGHEYWFCRNGKSWQNARGKCQAAGLDLVTISSATENDFVRSELPETSWIGANDTGSEGVWRWAQSGVQFWQGGAFGSAVGGAYRSWSALQPDNFLNQDCGVIEPLLGKWQDEACSATKKYVCESVDDLCPGDASKNAPGQCGCGNADSDSDSDGVADCDDLCPSDDAKVAPGDCGCASAPAAVGTACDDGLCAANTQCNGAGNCGSPSACGVPDSLCHHAARAGAAYWVCNNDRSFADARSRCQSVGMDLAIIESEGEDDFITDEICEHSFVGGTDEASEGDWVWTRVGQRYWDNGPGGSSVPGAYTNWEAGQPSDGLFGGQDCMVKDPPIGDGKWETRRCTDHEAYVCERLDFCPDDTDKLEPGDCGCGLADVDTDQDGELDCHDECPWDPTHTAEGDDGCASPTCQAPAGVLTPEVECVLDRADGTKAAVFAVRNSSACLVAAPIGADNRFTTGEEYRGQPAVFEPGYTRALATTVTGPLTWSLGGKSATADASGPACTAFIEQLDTPVTLGASFIHSAAAPRHDAHIEAATPISFVLPATLAVAAGNASDASAELAFQDAQGAQVTCTYRGGSSVLEPQTDLDFARGRVLDLVSCSNGATAGTQITGTQWDLRVLGGDPRFGGTGVRLDLGGGCSGTLSPGISAEQSVQLRDGFSWAATTALPETTTEVGVPTPVPALYYALIYVENDEQLELLRSSGVFFRQLPLFPSELNRYRGKCGSLDSSGDLRGQFLFSLLPGTVYNYLRTQALAAGATPLFHAVVLRPIPDAGARNADGTASWRKLLDAGCRYLDIEVAGQAAAFSSAAGPSSDLLGLVHNAWGSVSEILCPYVDRGCYFVVDVRLHLSVLNRDPLFKRNTVMTRAWGPVHQVYPAGIDVEIMHWSSGGPAFGHGKLSASGNVDIKVPQGSAVEGSGLCLHLANSAGRLVEIAADVTMCDFRDLSRVFGSFRHDIPKRANSSDPARVEVFTAEENTYLLSQVTDGYRYMKYVAHAAPRKPAQISVGGTASLFGLFNEARAFVPSTTTLKHKSVTSRRQCSTSSRAGRSGRWQTIQ